jgi:hypothetical protein
MSQNYIIGNLSLNDLKNPKKIIIPQFQRGIVWNMSHRKDFIDTVKSGDPFGIVLVYQDNASGPYILIDGLQRLSTLKAYMARPLDFVDENDKFTDREKLQSFFQAKYEFKGMPLPKDEKLEKEKRIFLKKMISTMKESRETPNAIEVWKKLDAVTGFTKDNSHYFDLFEYFNSFYQSFIDNLQLPDIIINAIIYQGPKDRLPVVFEQLNTHSVTLSKYEIFSSKWPITRLVFNDESIIAAAWSKYAELKNSSTFEVSLTEDTLRNDGITLFEYCFAFSELITNKDESFSFLFSKEKKSTDPTGFDLLALACGLPVNKADALYLDEYLGGTSKADFLTALKNDLVESTRAVERSITNWVHDLAGTPIKNGNLYQIYHMIISYFKHAYTLNLTSKTITKNEDPDSEAWIAKFNQYAGKWYLYHRLTGFWNQNRQVNDLSRQLNESDQQGIYITNISRTSWEAAYDEYRESIKDASTTRLIDNDTKLFMNYLYKMLIMEDKNRTNYFAKTDKDGKEIVFDIEHIVPVKKFEPFEDEDLPMSAIGNLCYLPVKDNRSKRDQTIYEYAADRPSLTFNDEFLNLIKYPSRQDLEFIDCGLKEFQTGLTNLISQRELALKDQFLNLITRDWQKR